MIGKVRLQNVEGREWTVLTLYDCVVQPVGAGRSLKPVVNSYRFCFRNIMLGEDGDDDNNDDEADVTVITK